MPERWKGYLRKVVHNSFAAQSEDFRYSEESSSFTVGVSVLTTNVSA
jgi:hypothetical protein